MLKPPFKLLGESRPGDFSATFLLSIGLLLALALAAMGACQNKEHSADLIRISSNSAGSEHLDLQSNLVLRFNTRLAPDSALQRWENLPYLLMDPPVEGRFRWISGHELEFSPSRSWAPATQYSISMGEAIRRFGLSDKLLDPKSRISVRSPELKLENANVFWTRLGPDLPVQLQADLNFNFPVEEQILRPLLIMYSGTNPLPLRWLSEGESAKQSLLIDEDGHISNSLTVYVEPGLKTRNGNLPSSHPQRLILDLPPPDLLDVRELLAQHDGSRGTVEIQFNQSLQTDIAKSLIGIQPAVEFFTEIIGNKLLLKSSDFAPDKLYTLTLKSGLGGDLGGVLKEDFQRQFGFGQLEPSVRFIAEGKTYLGRSGGRNLAVEIHSLDEVEVSISKIFENNIQNFLRQGERHGWDYFEEDDDYSYHNYRYYEVDLYGEEIYSAVHKTKELPRSGHNRLLKVDLADKLSRFNGIYVVKVSSRDRRYLTDSRIIALSDIGLMTRKSAEQVMVFAHSLQSAKPLVGIDVQFFSTHNQLMYSTTTDAGGIATYNWREGQPLFEAGMISARSGTDYNFLSLENSKVDASRFGVGGFNTRDITYDAFLYAERDLYRPGEQLKMAGVVRGIELWENPGSIPVILRLTQPNGQVWKTARQLLNDQGAFEWSVDMPASLPTGRWTAHLYSGNNVHLGELRFSLEEFMPDRIRLNTAVPPGPYRPGDSLQAVLQALNFFGPPAVDRNWQGQLKLRRKTIVFSDFEGYKFDPFQTVQQDFTQESRTNEQGEGFFNLRLPQWEERGLLEGQLNWTVFDESGRAVYAEDVLELCTQERFCGIGPLPDYSSTRTALSIPVAACDAQGKGLSNQALIMRVIKVDWENHLVRNGSIYRYESRKTEREISATNLSVSGKNVFSFTPMQSGQYKLRLSFPGSNAWVERDFYAYGWGDSDSRSFAVSSEGQIIIQADRELYQAGEQVKLLFNCPFDGRLLITVERDKVLRHFSVETSAQSASLNLALHADWLPGVYINATLIRAGDASSIPLTVAHGYKSLRIEHERHKIPLTIQVEKQSRSSRTQQLRIKTQPGAQLTVAAVDQGILQVSGMKDPDPFAHFFRKRALEVESADLYAQLFPNLSGSGVLSGGGDAYELESRLSPTGSKRVKPVSFWSGILQANDQGELSFSVDIPEFSGELRWMVAAWKGSAFGAAQATTTVADPLVISTALPRFLSPGDEVDVRVMLSNTSDRKAAGKLALVLEGPLEIIGSAEREFSAEAGRESSASFKIRALAGIGHGQVTAKTSIWGESFSQRTEIPVRPASGLQHLAQSGRLEGGQSLDLPRLSTLDHVIGTKLSLSRSPALLLSRDLEDLIQYPHGCLEQIISSAFPQLYLAELSALRIAEGQNSAAFEEISRHIERAMLSIQQQQISNGGLTYWRGAGEAAWWPSAYAAHFLYEAQKAGYPINEQVFNRLCDYLRQQLRRKDTFLYRYNSSMSREVARKEAPYSLYVLALAGKPDISTMNYYLSHPAELSLDGQYLLAVSYGLSGDMSRFERLLPPAFEGEESNPEFGGNFQSPLRDRALALNALLDIQQDHLQADALARFLSEQLERSRYLNTQEKAFSLLALGKIAARDAGSTVRAELYSKGKKIATMDGEQISLNQEQLGEGPLRIESSGSGKLYYLHEQKGFSTDGRYLEEDRFIQVRRRFFYASGKPVSDLTKLRQNDLLLVEVELRSLVGGRMENIAITDILPAGLEIENPRLRRAPLPDWVENSAQPDHIDFRDDRLLIYTNLGTQPLRFHYLARAVSPGRFRMGPIQADAMYRGEYHSYHGAADILISP